MKEEGFEERRSDESNFTVEQTNKQALLSYKRMHIYT